MQGQYMPAGPRHADLRKTPSERTSACIVTVSFVAGVSYGNAYHIYTALDFLIFSRKVGDMEMESRLRSDLDSFSTL